MPDFYANIVLRDQDGFALLSRSVPLVAAQRRDAFVGQRERLQSANAETGEAELLDPISAEWEHVAAYPEPTVLVRVTDRAGDPIQDACVSTGTFDLWGQSMLLGRTDSRGLVALRIVLESQSILSFSDSAKGFVPDGLTRLVRFLEEGRNVADRPVHVSSLDLGIATDRDFQKVLEEEIPDLEVRLQEAVEIRGRIVLGEDQPVGKLPLLLSADLLRLPQGDESPDRSGLTSSVIYTDDSGRFSFPWCGRSSSFRIDAFLTPDVHQRLIARHHDTTLPYAWVTCGKSSVEGTTDMGVLDLTSLDVLRLQVFRETGEVASHARVVLWGPEKHYGTRGHRQITPVYADQEGRASILVPEHVSVRIAALSEGQLATLATSAIRPNPIRVRLHATPHISGRVLDPMGIPRAGAMVHIQLRSGGPLEETFSRGADGVYYVSDSNGPWRDVYGDLVSSVVTPADGTFEFPVFPGGSYILGAYLKGSTRVLRRVEIEDRSIEDVTLVVDTATEGRRK